MKQSQRKTIRTLIAILALAGLNLSAIAQCPVNSGRNDAMSHARYGTWGFDLDGQDKGVSPGNNFFRYADGTYIDHLTIPPDRSSFGVTSDTAARTQLRIRQLIENQIARPAADPGAKKVAALYQAFMNESQIEQIGDKPLEGDLAKIRMIHSKAAMAQWMGAAAGGYGASIFDLHTEPDFQDRRRYAVVLGQTHDLGLPGRDFYLDRQFAEKKAAYAAYVKTMLTLAKWPAAASEAAAIVRLETQIAQASWTAEQEHDRSNFYHAANRSTLNDLTRGFDLSSFLSGAGLASRTRFVVTENTALPKIAAVFAETPLATLKAWGAFRLVHHVSGLLPGSFMQAELDLHERSLSGQQELEPRWQRAIETEDDTLGEAVGRLYVDCYFPDSSKHSVEQMVANLRAAFRTRLSTAEWMSPATRTEAVAKLDGMGIKVGYPAHWKAYGFAVNASDLYGDVKRGRQWAWREQLHRLNGPVDRQAWSLLPQDDYAMNEGFLNEIVFPAAFLEPPFFDPAADPAVNYGAIGVVIGHEMTHAFDDQGRKIDDAGRLRDWWSPEDSARFNIEAGKLAAQYAAFEPLPGVHVNGNLTLGEDLADTGGVNVALDAYYLFLGAHAAPILDGTTGEQRFFLSCAQVWRSKRREDALRRQLAQDVHPPPESRVNGEIRNNAAWYQAFGVKPGDKLYIAPEERVRLW